MMIWVALGVLREFRPVLLYILVAVLFIFSQFVYFFLNKVRDIRIRSSMGRLA